jgi:hypothetical protein
VCDFSSGTISTLLKQGVHDALDTLAKDAAYDQIDAFINEIKKQNVEDQNASLYIILSFF